MAIDFRKKYKVQKSNVEESYEYQLGLKNNEEYEKRVDSTFLQIITLFKSIYPNVTIETPVGREKSNKSLLTKIENLEIERLCKLYAIEGLSEKEKGELYQAILKSVNYEKEEIIKQICYGEIKDIEFLSTIMENDEVPEKTKTGLLRIIKTRLLEQEQTKHNKMLQKELDEKYGTAAAERTGKLKYNLLKWETIENLTQADIEKIHNPFEYLKVKDLMGFKLAIGNVPEYVQTSSEKLKALLKAKAEAPIDKKSEINDLCALELAKEFAFSLMGNQEILEKMNIQVIPNGYKHKEKQNGYMAEHIKFCYIDKPEYTFEFQIHSAYREKLSMANGPADHARRSGKQRIFPSTSSAERFKSDIAFSVPKRRILIPKDGVFYLHKCTIQENITEFYTGYNIPMEEMQKGLNFLENRRIR